MQLTGVLIPDPCAPLTATIASTAVSSALVVGRNKKFSITAWDDNLTPVPFQVGYAETATSASDFFPAGKYVMQSGPQWTSITVYNPTSGQIHVSVALLSNA